MNLLEHLNALVGPDEQARLGKLFGLDPHLIGANLNRIFATLLHAASGRAGQVNWPTQLQDVLQSFAKVGDLSGALAGGALDDHQGNAPLAPVTDRFLSLVLGDKQTAIATALNQVNGTSAHHGRQLLRYGGSLLAGLLGSKIHTQGLDIHKLLALLTGHNNIWAAAVPSTLAPLLAVEPAQQESKSHRWFWPVLLGLLVLALLLAMLRGCNKPAEQTEAANATVASAPAGNVLASAASGVASVLSDVTARLGEFFKLVLPDGATLNVPERGIEARLVEFIKDSSKPVDTDTWFSFDRLTFETGAATLMPESEEQLHNIASIMRAFPAVHLKLGGYTDNTGSPAVNMRLSADRANSVMAALVKLDVAQDRLSAEGYGESHPVASNDTEEGRAQNRRIDVRVTAK
ncbi:OmpA family protein [Silvimonas iriomotensis]|uniref:OmpA-like domain-containing protein n=1 Tax=Silvimonas iriomotensis TaxID=449662 RepID=A0ABQ2P661_9NEIS|nr:OmpA family protein [Silvimonas iriomotensis]GGP18712.1 hypothetical protein GCM10010970_06540 [Silvimonas iriomotensis]